MTQTAALLVLAGLAGAALAISAWALWWPRKTDRREVDIDRAVREAPYHLLEKDLD